MPCIQFNSLSEVEKLMKSHMKKQSQCGELITFMNSFHETILGDLLVHLAVL